MDEAQNINDEIVKMEPIKPKKFKQEDKVSWWNKIASNFKKYEIDDSDAKEEIPLSWNCEINDDYFTTLDEKMKTLARTGPNIEDFPIMAATLTRTKQEITNALDKKLQELKHNQKALEMQIALINNNIANFEELVENIKYHL
jgi:hypothetical protein